MVVGLSRTYLGSVATQQGLLNRVASSSSRTVSVCYAHHAFSRGYATAASAQKKEPKGIKAARKTASAKFASPEKQKQDAKKPDPKSTDQMSVEQLEEIERVMAFGHLMPTVDPWGGPMQDTLDVVLPKPVTLELAKSPRQFTRTILINIQNSLKTFMSLNSLRVESGNVPGVKDTSNLSLLERAQAWVRSKRQPKLKKAAILDPIKKVALETYVDLNTALANRNSKDITRFTASKYQEHMLALCKSSKAQNASGKMIWQMHRVLSPVSILSLRVTEGYLAQNAPRFGNRLIVHALVKFDTEQSLEMYNAKGKALHQPATELPPQWDIDANAAESWRVPAERKRVTEYLVLEKKMWTQNPWQFREQMW